MASPLEQGLDCKAYCYSMLLKSFGQDLEHTHKLQHFLTRLEEERLKIEAFKRELPLCMQLLNDACGDFKAALETYQVNQGSRPVLEEFIPLMHSSCEVLEKALPRGSKEVNWMTEGQIWSQPNNGNNQKTSTATSSTEENEQDLINSPKLYLDDHQEKNGGAFCSFFRAKNARVNAPPELALAVGGEEVEGKKCFERANRGPHLTGESCHKGGSKATIEQGKGTAQAMETQTPTPHPQRKARRCWSLDLHRRFVNALQMLGGSHAATPKQIREIMNVDGLTNDEIKSHLQKYRLHTRRPGLTPPSPATQAPQLVVVSGIWVPPEYTTTAHSAAPAIYSALPTPARYCASMLHHDLYPGPAHFPSHTIKASSQTHSPSESDNLVNGERLGSTEEDEEKSDSGSWRGRDKEALVAKGLLSLKEVRKEEQESRKNKIAFKF